jgi:apolipoprotein N-acyltransferase
LVGVFGLSWLLALTAAAIVLMIVAAPRVGAIAVTAIVAIWSTAIAARQITWSAPSGAPVSVALLQGNVDQAIKMREEVLLETMQNYLDLANGANARLIVMPETAIPRWSDDIPESYFALLKARAIANGGDIIVGLPTREMQADNQPPKQFNSALSLGISPTQTYSKDHLVAFGEFIPPLFSWVYQWLTIPLSGFSQGGKTQAPMRVSGHLVAINICYEDTFGAEIARPAIEAELLVNIANMAWYGRSLAAEQHLQFSQMRALETSRWMLRATNTGMTAAVNERGEVVTALPQFTRGVLRADVVPRQGATPYARWKDLPVLAGLALALLVAVLVKKRAARE